jgi:hypothetical protein
MLVLTADRDAAGRVMQDVIPVPVGAVARRSA